MLLLALGLLKISEFQKLVTTDTGVPAHSIYSAACRDLQSMRQYDQRSNARLLVHHADADDCQVDSEINLHAVPIANCVDRYIYIHSFNTSISTIVPQCITFTHLSPLPFTLHQEHTPQPVKSSKLIYATAFVAIMILNRLVYPTKTYCSLQKRQHCKCAAQLFTKIVAYSRLMSVSA